jgi:hypothetical protein
MFIRIRFLKCLSYHVLANLLDKPLKIKEYQYLWFSILIIKADHEALLNQIKEEKEHAVEEILNLSKKIGRLEEAVTIKEEETDKLCK